VNCCNQLYKGPRNSIIKSRTRLISHVNPGCAVLSMALNCTSSTHVCSWLDHLQDNGDGRSTVTADRGPVHTSHQISAKHAKRRVRPFTRPLYPRRIRPLQSFTLLRVTFSLFTQKTQTTYIFIVVAFFVLVYCISPEDGGAMYLQNVVLLSGNQQRYIRQGRTVHKQHRSCNQFVSGRWKSRCIVNCFTYSLMQIE
jgi:hypothetical protein